MADLLAEVNRFRGWATGSTTDGSPRQGSYGEWECDYEAWPALYQAVLEFVAGHPFASWSEAEVRAVLYAIARDNEMQYLANEIGQKHPEYLLPLTRAAIEWGERDDRWQLAYELGRVGTPSGGEPLLLELMRDEHEYVRRNALMSLRRSGSLTIEPLALTEWHRPYPDQEYARMEALICLRAAGSAHLTPLLEDAERDESLDLRTFAERIRRGEFFA